MSETPQFLEFSVPCRDVAESLDWYRQLGFAELLTGDIRSYHYAVVTDGDLCIGLYDNDYPSPGLSFVKEQLAVHVRHEQSLDVEFDFARLGEDEFHEAALTDPDGTLAVLLEARTFSGASTGIDLPLTGALSHIELPCSRLQESVEFWQHFGFIAVTSTEQDRSELNTPGLSVELVPGVRRITLNFKPDNLENSIRAIEREQPVRETTAGYELIAPEGTRIKIS